MATYLVLGKLMEKGIQNLEKTVASGERFINKGKEYGVEVRELMWLTGEYDVCCILSAESDKAIGSLLFKAASKGYIKTSSFKSFPYNEVQKVLEG